MLSSFASCNEHLGSYLGEIVREATTETVRVSHLSKAQATEEVSGLPKYRCGCNKTATWYIRISSEAKEKP